MKPQERMRDRWVKMMRDEGWLARYVDVLCEINIKVNLFSRSLRREHLLELLGDHEHLYGLMYERMPGLCVADIGSGNGLLGLGYRMWLVDGGRQEGDLDLVEPRKKKSDALREIVGLLGLKGVSVCKMDLQEYLCKKKKRVFLVSRGFPDNQLIVDQMKNGCVAGCGVISSSEKISHLALPSRCGTKSGLIQNRDRLSFLFVECFT